MARKKEFDTELALENAMQLFWLKGYERTSLNDLLEAMKIGRASFYNAYTDKHTLFIQVLKRYLKQSNDDFILAKLDESASPLTAIIKIFREEAEFLAKDMDCKGCLMVNAEVELMKVDDESQALIRESNAQVQARFQQALYEATEKGEIAPDQDTQALAEHLMNSMRGLKVLGRHSNNLPEFERVVDVTITALKPTGEIVTS